MDNENKNTLWADSTKLEIKQILDYEVFKPLEAHEKLPEGYDYIPYHMVYDVKFDGRRKSRLVAGGHRAPIVDKEERFSGVVSMDGVRLGFLLAKLNGLMVCAGDVGNAFLYGTTREKVYTIAGTEFPPELQGKRLLIVKSLYGLASSAARYHEHCSIILAKQGFKPSLADQDLWYRKHNGHYEYVARYVDDIIAFAKDPMAIMEELRKEYVMKGVGAPQYYLGGDIVDLNPDWKQEGMTQAFAATTYIKNCVPKIKKMVGIESLPKRNTPMSPEYHPELDETELCLPEEISKYRSMIGSANWILTLGRFDIAYALNTLSRYCMAPRKGHFDAMIRVFAYLEHFDKGQLIIDSSVPKVREQAVISDGHNWVEFYPDAREDVPKNKPVPIGQIARLTCYVDADHARDKLTRKSVTGIVLMLNNTPITWISRRQKTVETSTYGSELVAARIACDLIIEWRYKLRMLGVVMEESSWLVGDNMSVVVNTTIPSSNLKKKHQACNYHRVRECIAAQFVKFGHIDSKENMADICTKPLGNVDFHYLADKYIFRRPPRLAKLKND